MHQTKTEEGKRQDLTPSVHPIVADIAPAVSADPDDDALLATALAAAADMIVSGDAHLLNLKHYQGIPIISAVEALQRIEHQAAQQ